MNDPMKPVPGGRWGKSVYDFTHLYLQEKGKYRFQEKEADRFIRENLDYPDSVDSSEEFFEICNDLKQEIDEVLEE